MDWVPKYLYKYYSAKGLIRFLDNGKVRFTQPSFFNDPFEFLPAVHRSSIKKIIKNNLLQERFTTFRNYDDDEFLAGLNHALLNETVISQVNLDLFEQIIKEWDKIVGVFCLTSDPYNTLMWSHYGQEFYGAALGFQTDGSFFKYDNDINLAKVGYRNKRPTILVDNKKYVRFGNQKKTHELFAIKSKEWSYEKEFRMIELLKNLTPDSRNPNLFLVDVPQDSIFSIILGPRMDQRVKDEIVILKNKKFPKAIIYNAILDYKSYKMRIE